MHWFWTVFFVTLSHFFFCQGKADIFHNLLLDVKCKRGFLGIHHQSMAHLPRNYANAIEISIINETAKNKAFQRAFGFPEFGTTFFFGSVGNNTLLGNYVALSGFAQFPLLKFREIEWNSKLGTGLAYTNKCYQNEPQNIPIGTYINAQICLGTQMNYRVKNTEFHLGFDITHFSNAASQLPNYGINVFYLTTGISQKIPTSRRLDSTFIPSKMKLKKWLIGGTLIGSWKEIWPIGGDKKSVLAGNFYARRYFNLKSGIEVSLDLIHKSAVYDYLPEIEKTPLDIFQCGIYGAYLIPLERFHFVFGMGVYIRDKYKPEDPVYHRIGMRYQFDNGLATNITLKTHFGRADYLEWGLGYTINNR